ncbi:alpha/beta hydrolase [Penicillium hordei]|uniref:Alpha/beta hydrolase n=1 Tax=Penicillium hordei TaxID=40994 RepID=A0AAD6E150_9EURO|nr:alpha/beta hydrolase [Penicillium hordei]KAJ5598751.1 alpha/beta hydrolase [Penicillium hordei]
MDKPAEKISFNDPHVQRRTATINGKTYAYLYAEPVHKYSRTIFLIHGFPDLSMGWRYQIPFLLKRGLRVVCPDCMGYGQSDSPSGSMVPFALKSQCEDFYLLAKQLGCEDIILGGHDWGSVLASRFALYFPDFITHLITFVVPYFPPSPKYVAVNDLVKLQPSFGYMLQFGSEDGVIESHTQNKEGIRHFLNALYGGLTQDGKKAITATSGIDFECLPQLSAGKLLDEEEMNYYVNEFSRTGLRGPCNTYRVFYQNFVDDLPLLTENPKEAVINCPTLFIRAMDDFAITSNMVENMRAYVPHLTVEEVRSSHWIMVQRSQKVNDILGFWLQKQGIF